MYGIIVYMEFGSGVRDLRTISSATSRRVQFHVWVEFKEKVQRDGCVRLDFIPSIISEQQEYPNSIFFFLHV